MKQWMFVSVISLLPYLLPMSVFCIVVPHTTVASPLPEGYQIFTLYEQGKTAEARSELEKYIDRDLNVGLAARKVAKERDMEEKLGIGITAGVISNCLRYEIDNNTLGSIPQPLLRVIDEVIAETNQATSEARRSEYANRPRIKDDLRFLEGQQVFLLRSRILVAMRQEGKTRAMELYEKHKALLLAQGISAEKAIEEPKRRIDDRGDRDRKENSRGGAVIKGDDLAICQLLLDYYQAASRRDSPALDAILMPGPMNITGKELIEAMTAELGREGFEAIRAVRFDEKTALSIEPAAENSFRVTLTGVLMTFGGDGKSVVQRKQSTQTIVKSKDGKYRIVQKRKSKGE